MPRVKRRMAPMISSSITSISADMQSVDSRLPAPQTMLTPWVACARPVCIFSHAAWPSGSIASVDIHDADGSPWKRASSAPADWSSAFSGAPVSATEVDMSSTWAKPRL